jgi:hypothetical protein
VLAVVLQQQLARAGRRGAGPEAAAFAHTYWWAMATPALALVPALVLAPAQRRSETSGARAAVPTVG